jgi:hypothetical protein
MFRREFSTA